jgi:hypothetical protein
MTSPIYISLTAKTAHQTGADFGVRAGYSGSAGDAMWALSGIRSAVVETSRNHDALAARGAG